MRYIRTHKYNIVKLSKEYIRVIDVKRKYLLRTLIGFVAIALLISRPLSLSLSLPLLHLLRNKAAVFRACCTHTRTHTHTHIGHIHCEREFSKRSIFFSFVLMSIRPEQTKAPRHPRSVRFHPDLLPAVNDTPLC